MPVTPTYPGVYIEEIPSGVRTIVGVATSITAFIGRATRGPVDKAVTINNFGDFERTYGGMWADSTLGYAVRDFYLNGGSQAVIVRLFNPTFPDETARQTALNAAKAQAQTAADAVAAAAAASVTTLPAPPPTPQTVATSAAAATSPAPTAQSVADAEAAAKANAVTNAANAVAPRTKAQLVANGLTLDAAYEGRWGNYLRARVDHDVSESVATGLGLAKTDLFNLTVRDTKTGVTEQFRNLSVKDSSRRVDRVLENESRLVRMGSTLPTSIPTAHASPAAGKDIFEDDNASTKVADDKKASDGNPLSKDAFVGTGKAGAKQGLYALEQVDLFNLLGIPPYSSGNVDKDLIDEAIRYCERRRAMLLIDPPTTWTDKEKAKSGIETEVGVTRKNAAVFFPRLRQPNPLRKNQPEDFVPCGAVAGLFARTDTARGVWKAPAGLEATLFGVPQLSVSLTDDENGELNPKGINCIRAMPAVGRVIWGSRTRVGIETRHGCCTSNKPMKKPATRSMLLSHCLVAETKERSHGEPQGSSMPHERTSRPFPSPKAKNVQEAERTWYLLHLPKLAPSGFCGYPSQPEVGYRRHLYLDPTGLRLSLRDQGSLRWVHCCQCLC